MVVVSLLLLYQSISIDTKKKNNWTKSWKLRWKRKRHFRLIGVVIQIKWWQTAPKEEGEDVRVRHKENSIYHLTENIVKKKKGKKKVISNKKKKQKYKKTKRMESAPALKMRNCIRTMGPWPTKRRSSTLATSYFHERVSLAGATLFSLVYLTRPVVKKYKRHP